MSPFSKLQALPKNAKPVIEWDIRDAAYLSITQGIQDVIEEMASNARNDNFSQLDAEGDNQAKLINQQLSEFYRPIYVRLQRDNRSWLAILDKKKPDDSLDYRLSESIERTFILPGLRELVWVKLYLLEHTGKDFEAKILLIS